MSNIFTWIIFGLIAGAIAKVIRSGKDPGGWVASIIIGIVGAIIGGYLGTLLGFGSITGFNIKSFLLAIGGSLLLLFVISKVKKK